MTTTIFWVGLICLVVGACAGYLLAQSASPTGKKRRELEASLRAKEAELKAYQQEVTTHFVKTSELIGNLTESYRSVHEHLAMSAMNLANPDVSRKLLDAGSGRLLPQIRENLPSSTAAPKDYAPTSGVLREDYGLRDDHDEPQDRMPLRAVKTTSDKYAAPSEFDSDDLDDDSESDPTLRVG